MTDPTRAALVEGCWALVAHVNDDLHEAFPIHAANAADAILAQPAMQNIKAIVDAAVAWRTDWDGAANDDLQAAVDHLLFGGHR